MPRTSLRFATCFTAASAGHKHSHPDAAACAQTSPQSASLEGWSPEPSPRSPWRSPISKARCRFSQKSISSAIENAFAGPHRSRQKIQSLRELIYKSSQAFIAAAVADRILGTTAPANAPIRGAIIPINCGQAHADDEPAKRPRKSALTGIGALAELIDMTRALQTGRALQHSGQARRLRFGWVHRSEP